MADQGAPAILKRGCQGCFVGIAIRGLPCPDLELAVGPARCFGARYPGSADNDSGHWDSYVYRLPKLNEIARTEGSPIERSLDSIVRSDWLAGQAIHDGSRAVSSEMYRPFR